MANENEALVERYNEAVERRDWDGLRDLVTRDFVVHEPQSIEPEPSDIEEHIEALKPFEWRIETKDIVSQGDKVATREVLYATQIKEFRGLPPSDKELSTTSMDIWRIEDGKVAEVWSSPDTYHTMDQLGMTFPQILWTLPKALMRKLLP